METRRGTLAAILVCPYPSYDTSLHLLELFYRSKRVSIVTSTVLLAISADRPIDRAFRVSKKAETGCTIKDREKSPIVDK